MKDDQQLAAVLQELVEPDKAVNAAELTKALADHKDVKALGPQTFVRVIADADAQVVRASVKRPANGLRLRAEHPAKVTKPKRKAAEATDDDKKKDDKKEADKK